MAFRKKICWSCMILFAGILFAIWSLTSCNDSNFKELKNIPTIENKDEFKYRIYRRQDLGLRFGHQIGNNSVKIDVIKILRLESDCLMS